MSCQDIKKEQDYKKKMLNVVNAKKKINENHFRKEKLSFWEK